MKVRELLTSWDIEVDQDTLDRFSKGIELAKKVMLGAIAGVTALSAAIAGLVHSAFEYIDSSNELAQSAGVTTQFFQELAFAASRAGISTEQLSTSLAFFQRNVHNARKGGKEAAAAFKELGVTQKQLKGLGSEALFTLVADKLGKIEDPAKRGALAMAVIGRGGAKLLPAFKDGAAGLAKIGDRARALGLVTGPEAEAAADALEASIGDLKGAAKGLVVQLGTALMPKITELVNRFLAWYEANRDIIASKLQEWLATFVDWVGKAVDWVIKVVQEVVKWVDKQGGLNGLLQKTKDAIEPLIIVFQALWFVIKLIVDILKLLGEVIGVTAAVLFLFFTEQIPAALKTVKEFFESVWQGISDFFSDIVAGIQATWQAAVDAIVGALDYVWQKINAAKNAVIETVNLLPGVNIGTRKLGESAAFRTLGSAMATAAPPAGGAKSAVFSLGDIHVNVGGTSATATEIGGTLQKAVRDEFDRMFRHAGADMGK